MPVPPSTPAKRVLEDLRNALQERGARLLFVLPFTHVQEQQRKDAVKAAHEVARALGEIAPILETNTAEVSSDRAEFSNTLYHASQLGRARRTDRLVSAFQEQSSRDGQVPLD
jgi:hypothetical protein